MIDLRGYRQLDHSRTDTEEPGMVTHFETLVESLQVGDLLLALSLLHILLFGLGSFALVPDEPAETVENVLSKSANGMSNSGCL